MATATINKKELKNIIRESLREVIEQELMRVRALLLPYVSEREQKNIEKLYRKPSKKVAKSMRIEI